MLLAAIRNSLVLNLSKFGCLRELSPLHKPTLPGSCAIFWAQNFILKDIGKPIPKWQKQKLSTFPCCKNSPSEEMLELRKQTKVVLKGEAIKFLPNMTGS